MYEEPKGGPWGRNIGSKGEGQETKFRDRRSKSRYCRAASRLLWTENFEGQRGSQGATLMRRDNVSMYTFKRFFAAQEWKWV